MFVPLLNLPCISSRELWRLRPEFGTSLRLSQGSVPSKGSHSIEDAKSATDKTLLESLVTIADVTSATESPFRALFSQSSVGSGPPSTQEKTEIVLVDHNAISIPTLPTDQFASRVDLVGCIDHHIDESTVPSKATPRIIKTGIGSCTSLVVQHLRDSQLWKSEDATSLVELSKFALAPILIDTANLTAKDKVSDTDRDAVAFLESFITSSSLTSESVDKDWDIKAFYDEIAGSKANSLNLLNIPEIFERDYKQWTESNSNGKQFNIGIASVVQPLKWLLEKSHGVTEFVKDMQEFIRKSDLSLFGIMTTSTSANGNFQRELLIMASDSAASSALERFEARATNELQLEDWTDDSELPRVLTEELKPANAGKCCIWSQRALGKSRKQVAPLLRDMVKET